MMKAVWKKLIAVAFCGATAASMLSVGASAAWYDDNLIPYGIWSESNSYRIDDDDYDRHGEVYVKVTAQNWQKGTITAEVRNPSWVTIEGISWTGKNIEQRSDGLNYTTKINDGAKSFDARCAVTFSYKYSVGGHDRKVTETMYVDIASKAVFESQSAAETADKWRPGASEIVSDSTGGYYNDKWYDRYDWDRDKIYWDGDYYWYYSGGRWHATTSYPGLPDWDRPSRPSYSKEYEVDWSDDTFYYNGKVQMPSATVTIGGRTIELDVKLISGDGKSVGRHRVRASVPSRYSRYDITGTNFYYEIEEPEKDGFVTENGNTYYYDNGRKVTGWQTINGSRYYFLDNGEAADGWVKDGPADWYYFSDGKMQTGWINDNGTTYYCYGTGKMCHGRWHEIAGKWYYFNESGAMLTSQWILDKGNWYYVAGDGVMATNTTVPGGYRVNASGVWVK